MTSKKREPEYRDEGCEVSPSCLNCPLPICRHDNGGFEVMQTYLASLKPTVGAIIAVDMAKRANGQGSVYQRKDGLLYGGAVSLPTGRLQNRLGPRSGKSGWMFGCSHKDLWDAQHNSRLPSPSYERIAGALAARMRSTTRRAARGA